METNPPLLSDKKVEFKKLRGLYRRSFMIYTKGYLFYRITGLNLYP